MQCPRCQKPLTIEQQDNSNYKIVKCYFCNYWRYLKHFNLKK